MMVKISDDNKDKDDGKWTNRRIVLVVVFPIIVVGLVGSIGEYLFFSKDNEKNDKKV